MVGDVLADVLAQLSLPLAEGSDTPARISLGCGGSAANVAAWLAVQGIATALVGAVGDDPLGALQASDLRQRGIRDLLTIIPSHPTGVVVALVDSEGQRSMLTSRGAAKSLRPSHLPSTFFQPGRHLHLSGYLLLDAETREAGLAALALARAAGMTVSVDPSSREPLRRAGSRDFRGWTRGADLLFPNLDEGSMLAARDEPGAVADDLLTDYREVVLSLGAGGALWAHPGGRLHLPAEPGPVVDTTGAGDAFAAGWLGGWLSGRGGEESLHAALHLGALAVATEGARPAPRLLEHLDAAGLGASTGASGRERA